MSIKATWPSLTTATGRPGGKRAVSRFSVRFSVRPLAFENERGALSVSLQEETNRVRGPLVVPSPRGENRGCSTKEQIQAITAAFHSVGPSSHVRSPTLAIDPEFSQMNAVPKTSTQRARLAQWLASAIRCPQYILAAAATVSFPPAVLFPLFSFQPRLYDPLPEAIVSFVQPGEFDAKTPSVLGGIASMFTDGIAEDKIGDVTVAVVLALFSVFFPAIKLALLWGILVRPGTTNIRALRRLESLGPWSMADVFVISVGLLMFKSFPGGSTFAVETGYYLFLLSVVCGLLATWLTKTRLERMALKAAGSSRRGVDDVPPPMQAVANDLI
jgi:hypothetical protein